MFKGVTGCFNPEEEDALPSEKEDTAEASSESSEKVPEEQQDQTDAQEASSRPDRWHEFVRTLRTFYDHFRVAFPHLEHSEEWSESFRTVARKFVEKEDTPCQDGLFFRCPSSITINSLLRR